MHDGTLLASMLAAPVPALESARDHLNTINAFPVPDGDSGTNMLYTWRAVASAMDGEEAHAGLVAKKAARAALLAARGNSGIILSQMLSGFSKALKDKATFDTVDFAAALQSGRESAYKSVTEPVEGTILTVMNATAQAAVEAATQNPSLEQLLLVSAEAARTSLATTPDLLPVLKDRGVVDSGGFGFCVILEAMRDAADHARILTPQVQAEAAGLTLPRGTAYQAPQVSGDARYGWEVQFTLEPRTLSKETLREKLRPLGDSLLVVGDDETIKVHIHSLKPQAVLDAVLPDEDLSQVTFEDLDAQARTLAGRD